MIGRARCQSFPAASRAHSVSCGAPYALNLLAKINQPQHLSVVQAGFRL